MNGTPNRIIIDNIACHQGRCVSRALCPGSPVGDGRDGQPLAVSVFRRCNCGGHAKHLSQQQQVPVRPRGEVLEFILTILESCVVWLLGGSLETYYRRLNLSDYLKADSRDVFIEGNMVTASISG